MTLTIDAIIPTHNSAAFIERTVASIRRQSRPVDRILVVDDASTDDTADIVESLGVEVIRCKQNAGPSAARNRGARALEGECIAFLDADDVWEPEHCEVLAGLLEGAPGAAMAFSRMRPFWEVDGELFEGDYYFDLPVEVPCNGFPFLIQRNTIGTSAVLVRREHFGLVGGFDEDLRFSEDYDLWLSIARCWPIIGSPRWTARRRFHDGQTSHGGRLALVQGAWMARTRAQSRPSGSSAPVLSQSTTEVARACRVAWHWDWQSAWEEQSRASAAFLADTIAPQVLPAHQAFLASATLKLCWRPWTTARALSRHFRGGRPARHGTVVRPES